MDVMKVAPDSHDVIFEDEKIRVLKFHIKPGQKAEMHSHPKNVSYVLNSGHLRITTPDDIVKEVILTAGQTASSGPVSHRVENTGNSEVQTIQIELR